MTPNGLVIRFDEYGAAYSEAPNGEWTRRPELDRKASGCFTNLNDPVATAEAVQYWRKRYVDSK